MSRWVDYTEKRDLMLERTHSSDAPWIIVRGNDKRRARLAVVRHIVTTLDYADRDSVAIGKEDRLIVVEGPGFLAA